MILRNNLLEPKWLEHCLGILSLVLGIMLQLIISAGPYCTGILSLELGNPLHLIMSSKAREVRLKIAHRDLGNRKLFGRAHTSCTMQGSPFLQPAHASSVQPPIMAISQDGACARSTFDAGLVTRNGAGSPGTVAAGATVADAVHLPASVRLATSSRMVGCFEARSINCL